MPAPNPTAKEKVIVICGPTGAGKTRFAIDLAGYFKAEIVGADSMQIYADLQILSARPDETEQGGSQVLR